MAYKIPENSLTIATRFPGPSATLATLACVLSFVYLLALTLLSHVSADGGIVVSMAVLLLLAVVVAAVSVATKWETLSGNLGYLLVLCSVLFWFLLPAFEILLSEGREFGDRYNLTVKDTSVCWAFTQLALFLSVFVTTYWWLCRLNFFLRLTFSQREPRSFLLVLIVLTLLAGLSPYFLFGDSLQSVISDILAARSLIKPWEGPGVLGDERSALLNLSLALLVAAGSFVGTWGLLTRANTGLRVIGVTVCIAVATLIYFDQGTRTWVALALLPPFVAWGVANGRDRRLWKGLALLSLLGILQAAFEIVRNARTEGWTRETIETVSLYTPHFDNDFMTDLVMSVDLVPKLHGYFGFGDFLAFVVNPVPRAIWPDKPISPILLFYNEQVYRDFLTTSSTKLPSIVGQFYMSLGFFGVALLGLLAAFVAVFTSRSLSSVDIFVVHGGALVAVWWFLQFRGLLPGWIYPLIVYFLLTRVGSRRPRLGVMPKERGSSLGGEVLPCESKLT